MIIVHLPETICNQQLPGRPQRDTTEDVRCHYEKAADNGYLFFFFVKSDAKGPDKDIKTKF